MGLKRTLTNKAPNEFIIFSARFMVSFCQKVQVLKKLMDFFEINVEKISNFRWFFSTPLAS